MAKGKSYNPLLKSYPDSEKINAVSEGAEVLYVRLLAVSDDAGRYYGDAEWVLSKLFTHRHIKKQVSTKEVERRIDELERVGLLRLYVVDDKRYIELVEPVKSLRTDRPKSIQYPEPSCGTYTSRKPSDNQLETVGMSPDGQMTGATQLQIQPNPVTDPATVSGGGQTAADDDCYPYQMSQILGTPEFLKSWDHWIAFRKSKRKPVSNHAAEMQLKQLEPLGPAKAIECINLSIANDYQGLFPERVSNAQRPGQSKINASAGSKYREGGPRAADHGKF